MAAPSYAGTILVLGDSLSAAFGMAPERGWVHLLRKQLNPTAGQHRVINASISGETTAGGAARLSRLLERHRPTVVIIELGGNDGLRGVALRDSRTQLEFMIDLALTQNADVLLRLVEGRVDAPVQDVHAERLLGRDVEAAPLRCRGSHG